MAGYRPTRIANGDRAGVEDSVDIDTAPSSLLETVTGKVGIALTEAEKARSLRVIWTRRMGLDEDEITESLRVDPPANVETEMAELLALERLKTTTPSRATLEKVATKYY
jgi:hypothetical protein